VYLPQTFGEFSSVLFNALPKVKTVHFMTDCYRENSIKDAERIRRDQSKTYLIGGPATKLPRDFSSFLMDNENKRQLLLSSARSGNLTYMPIVLLIAKYFLLQVSIVIVSPAMMAVLLYPPALITYIPLTKKRIHALFCIACMHQRLQVLIKLYLSGRKTLMSWSC